MVGKLAADKTLSIEDSVGGVHGNLVLGCITDQTLGVGEGNERRCGSVTLIVGDDVAAILTEDTHARVRGTQVNTDSWTCRHDDYWLCVKKLKEVGGIVVEVEGVSKEVVS